MRDISHKVYTQRIATAVAVLHCSPATIDAINAREVPKGDPLEISKAAAIQAAKNTPLILPYCHTVPLDFVGVSYELSENRIEITVTVKAQHKTGVEMEALTAASAAALNFYDMLKMLDDDMTIEGIRLASKKGGKSDWHQSHAGELRAAVVVMSDSIAAGEKDDRSGAIIADRLVAEGLQLIDTRVIPDDPEAIEALLRLWTDEERLDLVLTTGGTGFGPRDNTPEVMERLIERDAPGIAEAIRAFGQRRIPYAMLSRARAGLRGKTLIINLPGSPGGVQDGLDALMPAVLHAFPMLEGAGHVERDAVAE